MKSCNEPRSVRLCHAKRNRGRVNGAVTVEYAIIFPLVIFVVMLLIYFGLVYYEQALLQSVVTGNTQNWAFLWGYDPEKVSMGEGILNRAGYGSKGLYNQVFSGANRRQEIIRKAILEDYQRKSLLRPSREVQVEVSCENFLILQKVRVKATACYPIPMKGFFQAAGLKGDFTVQAFSETTVHDPKEFIMNVDYLLQIYEESGAKDWVQKKCKPLTDALKKVRNYLK